MPRGGAVEARYDDDNGGTFCAGCSCGLAIGARWHRAAARLCMDDGLLYTDAQDDNAHAFGCYGDDGGHGAVGAAGDARAR